MSDEDWDIRIKPGSAEGTTVSITAGLILVISSIALVVTLYGVFLRLLKSGSQDLGPYFGAICISALFLLIGIALAVRREKQIRKAFEAFSLVARGEVVDRGITTWRSIPGEDGQIHYASLRWVVVQFQAVTSASFEGVKLRAYVSRKVYKKLIPGISIVIQYSSANPLVALLEGE